MKQVGNAKPYTEQRSAIKSAAYFWVIKRDYIFG